MSCENFFSPSRDIEHNDRSTDAPFGNESLIMKKATLYIRNIRIVFSLINLLLAIIRTIRIDFSLIIYY